MNRFSRWLAAPFAALALAAILLAAGHAQSPTQRAVLASGDRPTWSVDLRAGLPAGSTFTRASSRSCTNAAGIIVTLSTNVPCFDYDPVTLQPWGYLAEMQSTNSQLRSQEFDNAAWTTESRTTVSANAAVAPDGTTTADKVLETAANQYHIIYGSAVTVVANASFGVSIFAKAAENSLLTLSAFGATGTKWFAATVDLSAGTVTKTGAGAGGAYTSSFIRAVGNGWYRIGLIGSVNDTVAQLQVELVNTSNPTYGSFGVTTGYAGNASNGLYLWGGQFEAGGVGVTSYIPTAGSTVTRSQDILSLPLTSLPGWNGSKGGVLVAAYRLHTLMNSQQGAVVIDDTSSENNAVAIIASNGSGATPGAYMNSGGSQITAFDTGVSLFTRYKRVAGWQANRIVTAVNGGTPVVTASALALPVAPANMRFGAYGSASLNGTLESIAYYAGARPDAFVQGVSR